MAGLRSYIRELRQKAGLQQQDLAARVGVSRQALSAAESGEAVPLTTLALELARALGCRVEDLFALAGADEPLAVKLRAPAGTRVALGFIRGGWVAHLLEADNPTPADGIVMRGARVRPLRDPDALRANLLVAGCDPALGLLGGHLLDGPARLRLHWIEAASTPALQALAGGLVHVAGLHLFDQTSGEHNVPAVRQLFADRPTVVVNLATWEQGFVMRSEKTRRFRRAADLAAPGVRVAGREQGSGAQALLERLLAAARIPPARLQVTAPLPGHFAVARSVAQGAADVGIATAAAAEAFGLSFTALAEDRFDLVMLAEMVNTPGGSRLLETLAGARFRKDIGALPGYGTARTGHIIARLAA